MFGRGFEELTFARDCGVEVAVVSSSYAVPALAHIPFTCRGVSESFWVLTGTTKDHQLSDDIRVVVRSRTTLVILMGMKHLPEIADLLSSVGNAETHVALIQNGSTPNEQVAFGVAGTIVVKVERKDLSNPAITVVGEVVRLAQGMESRIMYNEPGWCSTGALLSR